jgi:hypothetical protein
MGALARKWAEFTDDTSPTHKHTHANGLCWDRSQNLDTRERRSQSSKSRPKRGYMSRVMPPSSSAARSAMGHARAQVSSRERRHALTKLAEQALRHVLELVVHMQLVDVVVHALLAAESAARSVSSLHDAAVLPAHRSSSVFRRPSSSAFRACAQVA